MKALQSVFGDEMIAVYRRGVKRNGMEWLVFSVTTEQATYGEVLVSEICNCKQCLSFISRYFESSDNWLNFDNKGETEQCRTN